MSRKMAGAHGLTPHDPISAARLVDAISSIISQSERVILRGLVEELRSGHINGPREFAHAVRHKLGATVLFDALLKLKGAPQVQALRQQTSARYRLLLHSLQCTKVSHGSCSLPGCRQMCEVIDVLDAHSQTCSHREGCTLCASAFLKVTRRKMLAAPRPIMPAMRPIMSVRVQRPIVSAMAVPTSRRPCPQRPIEVAQQAAARSALPLIQHGRGTRVVTARIPTPVVARLASAAPAVHAAGTLQHLGAHVAQDLSDRTAESEMEGAVDSLLESSPEKESSKSGGAITKPSGLMVLARSALGPLSTPSSPESSPRNSPSNSPVMMRKWQKQPTSKMLTSGRKRKLPENMTYLLAALHSPLALMDKEPMQRFARR